ncbi:septal ring lytic transglycosylase RlpA family protein [Legionella resiliens]|uniref:Endolytic peptidoglycan transglycosylase RlpA n=1 Tax=Legionella resiliens TaxID=2905958 RepID=A0ABS8X7K8_9GAMM|nr:MULTISPECIES: septal ring lytic transglycosylase RlpA family protein [unclassified Legionella]MCE0724340.1 septal ring lytic transglycosylase RlpA family protein [Legionella sp. 9fVS26]MCE3533492.1 septal ring lytic transglycosylase RlpA family protein [Legionella sp. 8cVS16]
MRLTIKTIQYFIITALLFSLSACMKIKPDMASYKVKGKVYTPLKSAKGYKARGLASFYSKRFHNRKTSNGERYNMHSMTAAHRTLPFNTRLRVKNVKNGRTVVVRINDRGPFYSTRIIDLSYAAASHLGITSTSMVEIQALN